MELNQEEYNMLYYQYVLNQEGIIIQINSSQTPFESNSITVQQALKVKLGKTKLSDLE